MAGLIYRALLRLHPAAFRDRFGGEMTSIFDKSPADHGRLIVDATSSLVRQWLLRADFRKAQPAATSLADGHMFLLLSEETGLRARHWMAGGFLSLICFAAASILLSHGGNGGGPIIGSRSSSSVGGRIQGAPAVDHLDMEISVRPDEILDTFTGRALVSGIYRQIRILGALDANHDLVLSRDEIANAPAALLSLDRNHDGILDAVECLRMGRYKQPIAEPDPMRTNPALLSLDLDHDGRLSAEEIRRSAASLKLLDHDHDGSLSPEELLSAEQLKAIRRALQ